MDMKIAINRQQSTINASKELLPEAGSKAARSTTGKLLAVKGVRSNKPMTLPRKVLFEGLHWLSEGDTPFTPERLAAIAYQIASGMAFLHENGMVHRDLTSMNILLDDMDSAKISDFALAGGLKDNKELSRCVGTPHYTSPEVLERKRYGQEVDTY
jgi:serine/threonine protein kinase